MPKKTRKPSRTAKANDKPIKKQKEQIVYCDETDEKVYIRTLTVPEIKRASKTGDFGKKHRKQLFRIASPKVRDELLEEAAEALEAREVALLPSYGYNSWSVAIRISYSSGSSPLFRWFRGQLELACLPHLLEKIPQPPRAWKRALEEEEEEETKTTDLQERTVSALSIVAWQQEPEAPQVTTKWLSPNHEYFYSRKSAWEHASQLISNSLLLDKVLLGIGARGQELKPVKPTRAVALEVGKKRFLRDGLWVIGQEEAWQQERFDEMQEEYEHQLKLLEQEQMKGSRCTNVEHVPAKRRVSGLQFYIKSKRVEYRANKLKKLQQEASKRETISLANTGASEVAMSAKMECTSENVSVAQKDDASVPETLVLKSVQTECTTENPKKDCAAQKENTSIPDTLALKSAQTESATEHVRKDGVAQKDNDIVPEALVKGAIESYKKQTDNQSFAEKEATHQQTENGSKPNRIRYTLADADKELRSLWKTLDEKEQQEWSEKAKEYEANLPDEPPKKVVKEIRRLSPLEFYIRERRHEYRREKLAELEGDARFTLSDAASELRSVWKLLTKQERDEWKERANKEQAPLVKEISSTETETIDNRVSDRKIDQTASTSELVSSTELGTEIGEKEASATTPFTSVSAPVIEMEPAVSMDTIVRTKIPLDESSDVVRVTPSPPLEPNIEESSKPSSKATPKNDRPADQSATVKARSSLVAPKKMIPSLSYRLEKKHIDLCYESAMDHYHKVMHTVKARALHSELADGFDVLRERGRGRYDMELPIFDTPAFHFLTDINKASWMPVVREILGQDVILIHKGVFLSMPGAEAQVYHQDGPHLTEKYQRPCHAVNVFIPLVDLTLRNGPTEFCLGTHILGEEDYDRERTETPCVSAGTPVIFDYRLGHRGMGNSSGFCRPIVYCTYAASANGKEFRDSVNFSRRRYHKIGELVDLPLSREERVKKRRLMVSKKAEKEASDDLCESNSSPPNAVDATEPGPTPEPMPGPTPAASGPTPGPAFGPASGLTPDPVIAVFD